MSMNNGLQVPHSWIFILFFKFLDLIRMYMALGLFSLCDTADWTHTHTTGIALDLIGCWSFYFPHRLWLELSPRKPAFIVLQMCECKVGVLKEIREQRDRETQRLWWRTKVECVCVCVCVPPGLCVQIVFLWCRHICVGMFSWVTTRLVCVHFPHICYSPFPGG